MSLELQKQQKSKKKEYKHTVITILITILLVIILILVSIYCFKNLQYLYTFDNYYIFVSNSMFDNIYGSDLLKTSQKIKIDIQDILHKHNTLKNQNNIKLKEVNNMLQTYYQDKLKTLYIMQQQLDQYYIQQEALYNNLLSKNNDLVVLIKKINNETNNKLTSDNQQIKHYIKNKCMDDLNQYKSSIKQYKLLMVSENVYIKIPMDKLINIDYKHRTDIIVEKIVLSQKIYNNTIDKLNQSKMKVKQQYTKFLSLVQSLEKSINLIINN